MSKVLLISSNTTTDPLPVYPLGMALVAASLEKEGHLVQQLDILLYLENIFLSVEHTIKEFEPDFIGISIRNIDTVDSFASENTWYLAKIKDLVEHIKKIFQKPVILGGPAFSIMPEPIFELLDADFGIVGEGEILLNQLIQDLSNNVESPKIIYPARNPMDQDTFFSPLYEQKLVDFYFDQSGMLNYQTKRGCPYGCNYCSYPLIEGKKIRYQSPEFVVENLIRLKEKFKVDTVFFTDSVFNDPKEHYLKIAERMIQKNCNMKWAAYFRPEKIESDKLALLKRSGLYAMEIGSDAACDTTLKSMNKSFYFDTVLAINEICTKHAVPCAHFFIFGGAGETRETVLEGIKNIERLQNCAVFVFSGIRILPNTGIHKVAIDQGVIPADHTLLKPCYYISPLVDKDWMDDTLKTAFYGRKDRFFPPEDGFMRMRALKMFGFKGLLWDLAINIKKTKTL